MSGPNSLSIFCACTMPQAVLSFKFGILHSAIRMTNSVMESHATEVDERGLAIPPGQYGWAIPLCSFFHLRLLA